MANRNVTVYWSTGWGGCHLAKEFLSQKGVPFESKNVAEDPAAGAELLARTGRTSVPVIVVDDEVVVGFDRGRLQRLLGLWSMATVRCPDCGQELAVPPGAASGAVIECPNWAGLSLRLRDEGGQWTATIAHTVSCPNCDRTILLQEDARAGDVVECRGQRYRLTFEYGAFAAEAEEKHWCGSASWDTIENDHETGSGRAGPRRVAWRSALVALLPAPARRHRPRARQRGLHGRDDAVPLDPDPSRRARRRTRIRALRTRAPPLCPTRLPHGRKSSHARTPDRRVRRRCERHRPRPVPGDDVRSDRAADGGRESRARRRPRHERHGHEGDAMKRRVLPWLTVALLFVLLSTASAATSTVLLAVDGMTCGSWPLAVKRALEGLKGVARAEVNFREKEARVAYDPAQVTLEQMIAAVNAAGFRASVKGQGQ